MPLAARVPDREAILTFESGVVARLLVVAALVLLVACGGGDAGVARLAGPFERLDGAQASFADYRGRPVVVNFFSSTCVPCQTEMPAFEKIHQQLGDRVAFLGMDVQDTVAEGRAFVASVGVTWDIGRDPDAAILQQQLNGVGLPTTAVLDPAGKVVFTRLGILDGERLLEELRNRGFA